MPSALAVCRVLTVGKVLAKAAASGMVLVKELQVTWCWPPPYLESENVSHEIYQFQGQKRALSGTQGLYPNSGTQGLYPNSGTVPDNQGQLASLQLHCSDYNYNYDCTSSSHFKSKSLVK